MSSRDPTVNVTYGIMTMLYLTAVVVLNTLNIRLYEQEVLIPLQQGPEKAPTVAKVAPPQQVATSTTANTGTTSSPAFLCAGEHGFLHQGAKVMV